MVNQEFADKCKAWAKKNINKMGTVEAFPFFSCTEEVGKMRFNDRPEYYTIEGLPILEYIKKEWLLENLKEATNDR